MTKETRSRLLDTYCNEDRKGDLIKVNINEICMNIYCDNDVTQKITKRRFWKSKWESRSQFCDPSRESKGS